MQVPLKQSISVKLLRMVFAIYFTLTFLVTAVHVLLEYMHTQDDIRQELIFIEKTFRPALLTSLWELNTEQLQAIVVGINDLPAIVGLEILNDKEKSIAAIGKGMDQEKLGTEGVFHHSFTISREFDGNEVFLATVRFYSDSSVVLDRVTFGFKIILFNAIIKSTALWLLFLWAFRKYLIYPLTDFTSQVKQIDLDNIHRHRLNIDTDEDNELLLMEKSFNVMLDTIEAQKKSFLTLRDANETRLEADVENRTRQLAGEKERLAVTLRCISDGVIATDIKGQVALLNKTAEKLTGWKQEEADGKAITHVFQCVHEHDGSPLDLNLLSSLQNNETDAQVILNSKDDKKRIIAVSGSPIKYLESQTIGHVFAFRDITEERRNEQEILKVKKLESLGVLAGGIAHDFNNILTAIRGNISLATQKLPEKNTARPLLVDAEKASVRASKLTQQLLTFAKGGDPIKETSSISRLIQDTVHFSLRGSNISCRYTIPDDLWLVDMDSGQMSQVFQNLAINARHSMPEGGDIEICFENVPDNPLSSNTAGERCDNRYVQITFQDNGIGIPGTVIDKIFDPFFSTKQLGSGLGLAITHSIITKHGGSISVESAPGEGTAFTLLLPAGAEAPKKLPDEEQKLIKGSGTVLIMDDEHTVREVAQQMLIHLGYHVILTKNGEETVQRYAEMQKEGTIADVILMDLTIPGGMGGRQAAEEILNLNPDARIIVTSGYSTDPVMADFQTYGFVGALVKPFDMNSLAGSIYKALSEVDG